MRPLKIGTRGSKLAVYQAEKVKALINRHLKEVSVEIITIATEGDKNQTSPLSELGGKGVFIKALEQALLEKEIDIAVHSLKDVTATTEEGLIFPVYLEAESRFDCLICKDSLRGKKLTELPQNAVLGTSSVRRAISLKKIRPDLDIKDLRGNIDTRISRCKKGDFDAIVLSLAGVMRLGYESEVSQVFSLKEMIPSPGQGVIVLQTRNSDIDLNKNLSPLNHDETKTYCEIEHEIIKRVGLNCQYPFALYTQFTEKDWEFNVFLAKHVESDHFYIKGKEKKEKALEKAIFLGEFLSKKIKE